MPRNGFCLPHDLANRFDQPELAKVLHAGAKSADTRQHDAARRLNLADVAGDHGFEADALQPLLHAAQIAHPVIDNRNHVPNDLNVLNCLNDLNELF